MLMMADAAITGNSGMFFMVEKNGFVPIHQTVQFDDLARVGGSRRGGGR
jgi:hypothetical protein